MCEIINKLRETRSLSNGELLELLSTTKYDDSLLSSADEVRRSIYGDKVYIRGLIEFSNYCKNNCNYCGIRAQNGKVKRYRLTKEEILSCCENGYSLGFRTFVLQGGEDPFFTDEILCDIVSSIRKNYPDCAITLSVGERSKESYISLFNAGANRYLLRHEAINEKLYSLLHPEEMSLDNRKECLFNLKEIGYQVGTGFMVGAPFQTIDNVIEDIRFIEALQPDMIGIGPYVRHQNTPLNTFDNGSCDLTIKLVALFRHMLPYALIPATTALGTLLPDGRERALKAGANVVMPNLSPKKTRKLYSIYENKISTGEEAAESKRLLEKRVKKAGYRVVTDIGNVIKEKTND